MTPPAVSQPNVNRRGSTLAGVPGIAVIVAMVAVLLMIVPSAASRPTAEVAATYQVTLSVGAAPYTYQLQLMGCAL